ncbi:MAG: hypothetical protein IPO66_04040 [Rhodanobacteraceae bacterium]|nr:hypothetical protein [Rhodanobacteraceae bacterium]
MTLQHTLFGAVLLGACALARAAPPTDAPPSGGSYVLNKQVIAAGGNRSSGGSYQLVGTLGQNAAGRANAGGYQLQIGFHGAASNAPLPDSIFRNSFEN